MTKRRITGGCWKNRGLYVKRLYRQAGEKFYDLWGGEYADKNAGIIDTPVFDSIY